MDENKTGVTEFLAKAAAINPTQQKLIQGFAIWRMQRKGMITAAMANELRTFDWQSFLEWVLVNGPAIIEFIMMIIAIF